MDLLVSVVTAVHDDAEFIEEFIRDLSSSLGAGFKDYEIVLVDNASQDDTVAVINRMQGGFRNLQLYCLTRMVDADTAFAAGLERAVGDVVVTMDAGCDPVDRVDELISIYEKEGVDIVYGVCEDSWSRGLKAGIYSVLVRTFYAIFRASTGVNVPSSAPTFRLYSRRVLEFCMDNPERYALLTVAAGFAGYPYSEIRYHRRPRSGSGESISFTLGIRRAARILLLSSSQPLRSLSIVCLGGALLNMLYSGYVVVVNLVKRQVAEGWTSLSLQVSLMFFLLFLVLFVLCEYIVRIFMKRQNRPSYVVGREVRSLVLLRKQELNVERTVNQIAPESEMVATSLSARSPPSEP